MTHYRIVEAATRFDCETLVERLVLGGWRCQGGVMAWMGENADGQARQRYVQAMILEEEGEKVSVPVTSFWRWVLGGTR